ncbi:MAG TPA: glycosyltransferase family 2 protein [Tepidisphaeraceae bacterium]|jgi:cellulose synthase/poly-beta-1,6-N-acetylglucosamine synthase-like glycosyltransferase
MSSFSIILFWSLVTTVAYTYVLYPLIIALLARRFSKPIHRAPHNQPISIIIAAYNEEAHLERRIAELLHLCEISNLKSEILIASDGSTDRTNAIALSFKDQNVHLIPLPTNQGKSAALSQAALRARHDILLFADARQRWDEDTIPTLLENFADDEVGAVSGDLVLETQSGTVAGVGLYWKFEKWLRRRESDLYSMVSVSGSIAAVRRELFIPIPKGCLLDDVYWPLNVAMQNYRVIHDDRAKAYDRLPEKTRDEFKRKVRTLSGNFQLLKLLPRSLSPLHNPVWIQFLSHKILRLVVPWALLALLALSCILEHPIYRLAFFAQLAFYVIAIVGLSRFASTRIKLASAAASFLVLNTAAAVALYTYLTGRATRSWKKVTYTAS